MASYGHANNGIMMNQNNNNNNVSTGDPRNTGNAGGPRSKCDQVVFEALCKACEIIVGSRSSSTSNGSNNISMGGTAAYGGSNGINNNSNATTSTRFNLQVPEIPGVREILSQYRYQLHAVPVRLDVYYQHKNGGRELLERWCFEYRPCSSLDMFLEAEGMLTTQKQDAIAQLRHVWKRIVIWLRALYVYSRFLPAHVVVRHDSENGSSPSDTSTNNTNIGFSLYVNGDGTDDVNGLVQQQGFLRQTLPSGHVTTPYGQLAGHVVYVPAASLQHLLPRAVMMKGAIGLPTGQPYQQQQPQYQSQSRPIPMNNGYQNNNNSDDVGGVGNQNHAGSYEYKRQLSAPATMMQIPNQQRPASYSERSQLLQQQQQPQGSPHHQHHNPKNHLGTYDPARLIPPRKQGPNFQYHHQSSSPSMKPLLQRRHTSIDSGGGDGSNGCDTQSNAEKAPERVMSGLSLALMMANNNTNGGDVVQLAVTGEEGNDNNEQGKDDADVVRNSSHEKRRAALHQMPPHLMAADQHQPLSVSPHHIHHHYQPACSGDYGYAYNHFSRQQKVPTAGGSHGLTPQTQRTNSFDSRSASPSPFSMQHPQNTPPTAAFLGACHTPVTSRQRSGSLSGGTAGSLPNGLIAPRRSSSSSLGKGEASLANGGITPPFHDRPLGFLHEACIAEVTAASGQEDDGNDGNYEQESAKLRHYHHQSASQQQLASLDLLHSSPFQLQHHEQSLLLSSLQPYRGGGAGTVAMSGGLDSVLTNYSNPIAGFAGGGFPFGYSSPRSAFHASESDSYYYEDAMPFAVDLSSSPLNNDLQHQVQQSSRGHSDSSSLLFGGQSATLASLAQKCAAPNHKLKLFESYHLPDAATTSIASNGMAVHDDLVSSLADQLEEFRSFSASIQLPVTETTSSGS